MPSFATLLATARVLAKRYGVKKAYENARYPSEDDDFVPGDLDRIPEGSPWTPRQPKAGSARNSNNQSAATTWSSAPSAPPACPIDDLVNGTDDAVTDVLMDDDAEHAAAADSDDSDMTAMDIDLSDDESMQTTTDDLGTAHAPPPCDMTLANGILFMTNGILLKEECLATALGDPGRIMEILKVMCQ